MSNKTGTGRPPLPLKKPGLVKIVRAKFDYHAKQDDELSFEEDDLLYIVDMSDNDWWKATCNGKTGLVPCAYVNENTDSIDCPLHNAVKRGNVGFMDDCLNNRISVNGLDGAGSTPLHWAAHGGHLKCLETLLAQPKCEINVQNKLGDTALHSAAWKNHPEAVKMLVLKGSRIDLKNNDNKRPLDLTKDPEVAVILREAAGIQSTRYDNQNEWEDNLDSE